jgi:hypothetical protein
VLCNCNCISDRFRGSLAPHPEIYILMLEKRKTWDPIWQKYFSTSGVPLPRRNFWNRHCCLWSITSQINTHLFCPALIIFREINIWFMNTMVDLEGTPPFAKNLYYNVNKTTMWEVGGLSPNI